MNSEAELASVLGHEIGHVTARHSVSQITNQQLAQIGVGLGIALVPELQSFASLASTGLQLLFLKYGRDDERQSDELGLRYMTDAGYDPEQMVEMFRTLARTSSASGAGRAPEWLSTHPNPENREQLIAQRIAAMERNFSGSVVNREGFLRRLGGLVYGPDPRAGYFHGQTFHQPDLAFRVAFPAGWQVANQPQAVIAMSPERDALMQLTLAREESADAAARAFFGQQGLAARGAQRGTVGGLGAVSGSFAASTGQGNVEGMAVFVEYGDHVYQLLGYGVQSRFDGYADALRRALTSFARETDPGVLNVQPWRLEIVTPNRRLSIEEFARFYPGPIPVEELARINQIDPGDFFEPGVPVKRVRGKSLPGSG
jgi:predicted Zn-dependent protease